MTTPGHAAGIGPLTCEDPGPLSGVPLVAYAEDLPILRRYWRHVFRTRLTARPAVVVPDLRGVLAAVVAGAGATVLPRYLCEAELASGALVELLTPEDPPINTGFLVARAGAPTARRSTRCASDSSTRPAPGDPRRAQHPCRTGASAGSGAFRGPFGDGVHASFRDNALPGMSRTCRRGESP